MSHTLNVTQLGTPHELLASKFFTTFPEPDTSQSTPGLSTTITCLELAVAPSVSLLVSLPPTLPSTQQPKGPF